MPGERVLVVDDEQEICELISKRLACDGMRASRADCGQKALEMLQCETFDLVVLDIMMRDMDGFDVLKQIRRMKPLLPVVFLSARQEDYDKILGFGLGADDYVTKPFSPTELSARIRAHIRRNAALTLADEACESIVRGELCLDLKSCSCTRRGAAISLSAREYRMLRLFMENPQRVFTKTQIYRNVWEEEFEDDNSVMVYISHIRDKIEDNPKEPKYIQTVKGLGYKFLIP